MYLNIVEVEQRRIFFLNELFVDVVMWNQWNQFPYFFKREREIGGILPHTRYLHVNEVSLKIPNVMRRDSTRIDHQVSETTSEHLYFCFLGYY